MTNGNKIREMTDEELAQWICHHVQCARCPGGDWCSPGHNGTLDWLKKEAENND